MAVPKPVVEATHVFSSERSASSQFDPTKLLGDFFRAVFHYKEYLRQSVARDLRKQYKRSYLGYIWSMLNPLLMMLVLAVVFSSIMRQNIDDYAVFIFCGMVPYAYFSSTLNGCLGTIRANAKIIDQLPVPKFLFPLSVASSNMMTFFFSLVPLALVIFFMGREFHLTLLQLPFILVPLFFATFGIALVLAAANVFFEDIGHLTEVALRATYFLTPILYRRDQLPEWLQEIVIYVNPMFLLVEQMRSIVYHGQNLNLGVYLVHLAGCFLLFLVGLFIFRKVESRFLYYL